MRVFVTGATGFVGSAIVNELINNGHQVLGLARSDRSAAQLVAAGADVHRGDLEAPETLIAAVNAADGVIHTAFNHDFTKFKENCEADRLVIETIGKALEGTDKPFVITSGIGILGLNGLSNELNDPVVDSTVIPRIASEEAADAVAAKGVGAMIVRLPPTVHGPGDHGFVPQLIAIAKDTGLAAYVGDGGNLWPAVHCLDAAALYRLVLEKGTKGYRYHAVAEQGIAMHEIMRTIGGRLNLPLISITPQQAAEYFGWMAYFAQMSCPASSQLTQQQLGWQPVQTGLIEDMASGVYI